MHAKILTLLAFATLALCQASTASLEPITPFDLQILSPTNTTLNNAKLSPCHREPAIESLCWSPEFVNHPQSSIDSPRFAFNASKASTTGILLYNLTNASSKFVIWEPLSLTYNFYTNIAIPLFQPAGRGSGGPSRSSFGFDEEGRLALWSAVDDRVVPFAKGAALNPLYRWFMCDVNVGAAYSLTLAWALGSGAPQNPSCQAVNVTRHFAS